MSNSWVRVVWIHAFKDDPVEILVELDAERYETRKIEYFADGRIGVATRDFETDLTGTSDCPMPDLEEINADPQFFAEAIGHERFEKAWDDAVLEC